MCHQVECSGSIPCRRPILVFSWVEEPEPTGSQERNIRLICRTRSYLQFGGTTRNGSWLSPHPCLSSASASTPTALPPRRRLSLTSPSSLHLRCRPPPSHLSLSSLPLPAGERLQGQASGGRATAAEGAPGSSSGSRLTTAEKQQRRAKSDSVRLFFSLPNLLAQSDWSCGFSGRLNLIQGAAG